RRWQMTSTTDQPSSPPRARWASSCVQPRNNPARVVGAARRASNRSVELSYMPVLLSNLFHSIGLQVAAAWPGAGSWARHLHRLLLGVPYQRSPHCKQQRTRAQTQPARRASWPPQRGLPCKAVLISLRVPLVQLLLDVLIVVVERVHSCFSSSHHHRWSHPVRGGPRV